MQYGLTEEQTLLQNMVRRLAKDKVAPGAGKRDETGDFDWQMVELMRENGLTGIDFPEEFGGSHAGMLAFAIAVEELAKVDAACSLLIADHELGAARSFGANQEQREKFLPKLSTGEHIAAFGLTEAAAGSDVARLRCRAKKDGDSYVVNGSKTFITNGGVVDIVTVYAVTDPEKPTHKNAGVFIVEKGTPGFTIGKRAQDGYPVV